MFGRRPNDNAWTQTDRQERRKTVALVVVLVLFAAAGVGLLIWSLAGH